MTYQDHFTLPTELLEQVAEQGLDFLPELIRIVINTAMQVERQYKKYYQRLHFPLLTNILKLVYRFIKSPSSDLLPTLV